MSKVPFGINPKFYKMVMAKRAAAEKLRLKELYHERKKAAVEKYGSYENALYRKSLEKKEIPYVRLKTGDSAGQASRAKAMRQRHKRGIFCVTIELHSDDFKAMASLCGEDVCFEFNTRKELNSTAQRFVKEVLELARAA